MTNLLLLVSMVLNGIALFCIVILYLRQNKFLEVEKKYERLLQEMEEVISAYLLEMTEENEKFIHKVRGLLSEQGKTSSREIPNPPPLERKNETNQEINKVEYEQEKPEATDDKKEQPPFRKGTVFQAVQAYKNTASIDVQTEDTELPTIPLPTKPEVTKGNSPISEIKGTEKKEDKSTSDLHTQSSYYQALLLQKQGLSTEEIAKRLKKGKTEIELLFKLRQKT